MNEHFFSGSNAIASHGKQSGLNSFMSFFGGSGSLKKNPTKYDMEFLEKVQGTVSEELTNPKLSTDYLAKRIFMSRSQLFRKMKALTGKPPSDFIRNSRLNRGYELLEKREGNISQISMSCGFKNEKHFSTRFKKRFGVSPREV